ncbi:Alpha/Beta hydrolase protein [Diaporthe sp. PMI_573]|nr:Alpha/Beta hydrolase protein [Diaporthaceae sp. PMI_573]
MAATQTVKVPHLGGIEVGYAISGVGTADELKNGKPTCVLINALHTTVAFWRPQFEDEELTSTANFLAIEPLGHGATVCSTDDFTYWDTVTMALQVMDRLGVERVFAMGTSQGGFIVARMALLAPDRIQGIVPIGTSMDDESEDTRRKGSWDAHATCDPYLERWSSTTPTPDFVIDEDWCRNVPALAFGDGSTPEELQFWYDTWRKLYSGDEGRKKARSAVSCLVERDGLLPRLPDVKCPVHWLHGSKDAIWPDALAREQIELFTASPWTKATVLEGGSHFLSVTHAKDVNAVLLEMIENFS